MRRALIWLLLCFTATEVTVTRVVDGDTFDIMARTWLNVTVTERVRVLDVDTWEMRQAQGPSAKAFTENWLREQSDTLTVTTCGRDSFGRILALVQGKSGMLADALKAAGMQKQ